MELTYLLDSNVLGEWTRSRPDRHVLEWCVAHNHELCVSPIIMGEVEFGVLAMPESRRKRELLAWISDLQQTLMIVDFDANDGMVWARLLAKLKRLGTPLPISDTLIAASALARGLTLVTRNERHFKPTGVSLFNPFSKT